MQNHSMMSLEQTVFCRLHATSAAMPSHHHYTGTHSAQCLLWTLEKMFLD